MISRTRPQALLALLAGICLVARASTAQRSVDFETDIQPLFTASCALSGCHTGETLQFGGKAGGGLVLLPGKAYQSLVGTASKVDPARQRVVPGSSESSILVLKLEGAAGVGSRMPQGSGPVDPAALQLIRDWIDQGALAQAPPSSVAMPMTWGGVKASGAN